MVLPFGAPVHAWWHGLFRQRDSVEVEALYQRVVAQFVALDLDTPKGRGDLVTVFTDVVNERLDLPGDHAQVRVIRNLAKALLDHDDLFRLPNVDWSERRTIAQWWEIKDELICQRDLAKSFEDVCETMVQVITCLIAPLLNACPALLESDTGGDGITVRTSLLECIGGIGAVTEAMLSPVFSDQLSAGALLPRLKDRLERNIVAASGGNPADVRGFTRTPRLPSQADARDPQALVGAYLGGTPMLALFNQTLDFTIPTETRFEHHHIVAGSGHGKTQTLQYLIARDLEAVAEGNRSVIVLDSQGDLIRNIASLKQFAHGEPLHDRIVIIDPSDVEWPVSLNLFDVGIDRLSGYAPLERERLTNSILELYDFVLGSLLSAEMTQKQNVIFRYVTRLMLHIPDATIHTLRELMEPDGAKKFAVHINKLTGTARQFFESEFSSREFEQTKRQVLRRLWGILENQTFERMFSHPRSKLDLFAEMNAGKVILINTAKDLLKEQGTEIFGRFFIALIAQAAQERATLPPHKRTPTIVYVDEAQDYFDRNIGLILAQARKQNVGMVLAHQYLGQLEPKLLDAFAANTAIKFAGGVSAKDARTLAPMLYCQPELIETRPKGSFAAHVRGQTKSAVPLQFPLGYLERQRHMNGVEAEALRQVMRDRYAVHYSELGNGPRERGQQTETEPPPPKPHGHVDTDAGKAW